MEVITLGCSGTVPSALGPASAYCVETKGAKVLLDAGDSTTANVIWHGNLQEISGIVLTHWHIDHVGAIPALATYMWKELKLPRPVRVFASQGVYERVTPLIPDVIQPVLEWHEVQDQDQVTINDLVLTFSQTEHPGPTVAVQCTDGTSKFVYTSDTGPKWQIKKAFGTGADLVIVEASLDESREENPDQWDQHLTHVEAGDMARTARATTAQLTHLCRCGEQDLEKARREGSRGFGDEVTLARQFCRTKI